MSVLNTMTQRAVVKSADEIMRRHLVALAPGDELLRSVGRLLQENISGAPVVGPDRHYLGVLSEKGCITALTTVTDQACQAGFPMMKTSEFMVSDLVTLSGDMDVFDAIDHLLARRISGAPVVDDEGRFDGIFSEKTAMRVLASALVDGVPGTRVGQYMNVDRQRIIGENDLLTEVAKKFLDTPYRRLPVLRDDRLIGQVSRRDVLRAELKIAREVVGKSADHSVWKRLGKTEGPQTVDDYMDPDAMTASPTTDLLGITQIFLNHPYRRLPIVDDGKLVGQISRRDLLAAAADIMRDKKKAGRAETLYLSGIEDSSSTPFV